MCVCVWCVYVCVCVWCVCVVCVCVCVVCVCVCVCVSDCKDILLTAVSPPHYTPSNNTVTKQNTVSYCRMPTNSNGCAVHHVSTNTPLRRVDPLWTCSVTPHSYKNHFSNILPPTARPPIQSRPSSITSHNCV